MPKFLSQTKEALVKKKRRWTPKGRQVDDKSFQEIALLLDNKEIVRDQLIEYLHLIQDNLGFLHDRHLVALADIMNIPQYNISKHLNILDNVGIIKKRKEGRWIYLSLSDCLDKFKSTIINSLTHLPKELTVKDVEKMNQFFLSKNDEKCS